MSNQGVAGARVTIKGEEVPTDAVAAVLVEQDIDQPDVCTATVNNTNTWKFSQSVNQGDEVTVKIGPTTDQAEIIFTGEVVGLEPTFDVGGETKVLIRAFNKLHRLTRTRKSKTFEMMTDQDLVMKIAGEYGLRPECKGSTKIKYDHVYQHHQSDFEFLLGRARRINYEILCDNRTLTFRERDTSADSGIELKWGKDAAAGEFSLQRFDARLNSANQVKEVQVRSWNPGQKQEIIGMATALASKLGSKDGAGASKGAFGDHKAAYELPVASKAEADAVAKSLLEDSALNYIVGEGQCKGHPKLKAGIVVKITLNDTRFDGKYYITGVSHRYSHKASGGTGGYVTLIRVRRNAEGA